MANSKLLINQWRNEPSSRDRLGHHLAFTKSDTDGEVIFAMASTLTHKIFNGPLNMNRASFRLRQQYQKCARAIMRARSWIM
jgi:hypothetical protein